MRFFEILMSIATIFWGRVKGANGDVAMAFGISEFGENLPEDWPVFRIEWN
jgi:hypothetical protein